MFLKKGPQPVTEPKVSRKRQEQAQESMPSIALGLLPKTVPQTNMKSEGFTTGLSQFVGSPFVVRFLCFGGDQEA